MAIVAHAVTTGNCLIRATDHPQGSGLDLHSTLTVAKRTTKITRNLHKASYHFHSPIQI